MFENYAKEINFYFRQMARLRADQFSSIKDRDYFKVDFNFC